ncbi:hypothetical protein [Massilia sp. ST3]|uniref:hypothetical protein n=1 Tax=Massilia sp. ST3 TaxID=2824903 RepID=UPI001B844FCD|nr:hypothetical protein [Massilia sp. ST3]MBQ5946265.1 hypothetical protein [Massilia sp. ST3]
MADFNTGKLSQDVFDRYLHEVSVHKSGAQWKTVHLNAIAAYGSITKHLAVALAMLFAIKPTMRGGETSA